MPTPNRPGGLRGPLGGTLDDIVAALSGSSASSLSGELASLRQLLGTPEECGARSIKGILCEMAGLLGVGVPGAVVGAPAVMCSDITTPSGWSVPGTPIYYNSTPQPFGQFLYTWRIPTTEVSGTGVYIDYVPAGYGDIYGMVLDDGYSTVCVSWEGLPQDEYSGYSPGLEVWEYMTEPSMLGASIVHRQSGQQLASGAFRTSALVPGSILVPVLLTKDPGQSWAGLSVWMTAGGVSS